MTDNEGLQATQDFIDWLTINCPTLATKMMATVVFNRDRISVEDAKAMYDMLHQNGYQWCINWELIALRRPSLN